MRHWGFVFVATLSLKSVSAQAEVEIEFGDADFHRSELFIRGVDVDDSKPLSLPKFLNPYADDTDDTIADKVGMLPAQTKALHISKDVQVERAAAGLPPGVDLEIWLPRNRCELGWVRWGSNETEVFECKMLGRGQTVFGSLKLLAGLQATQKAYKSWAIGELPRNVVAEAVKNTEHFATEAQYSHCLFKPESENNGATITTRIGSTIGHFLLDTDKKLHAGKVKWGSALDEKSFLLPVRMNKVESAENRKYAKEGILIHRFDFWLHSHDNAKDEFPLEAHSTWGCPRLPRSCQAQMQAWVATQNALGKKPHLVVHQEEPPTKDHVLATAIQKRATNPTVSHARQKGEQARLPR